ncbi:Histone-lysine N-methyltransferase trr [Gryllus bimaculatus]|nr:Histone-lysine N-methyltransferase trr [Gryllus bimaculatus]
MSPMSMRHPSTSSIGNSPAVQDQNQNIDHPNTPRTPHTPHTPYTPQQHAENDQSNGNNASNNSTNEGGGGGNPRHPFNPIPFLFGSFGYFKLGLRGGSPMWSIGNSYGRGNRQQGSSNKEAGSSENPRQQPSSSSSSHTAASSGSIVSKVTSLVCADYNDFDDDNSHTPPLTPSTTELERPQVVASVSEITSSELESEQLIIKEVDEEEAVLEEDELDAKSTEVVLDAGVGASTLHDLLEQEGSVSVELPLVSADSTDLVIGHISDAIAQVSHETEVVEECVVVSNILNLPVEISDEVERTLQDLEEKDKDDISHEDDDMETHIIMEIDDRKDLEADSLDTVHKMVECVEAGVAQIIRNESLSRNQIVERIIESRPKLEGGLRIGIVHSLGPLQDEKIVAVTDTPESPDQEEMNVDPSPEPFLTTPDAVRDEDDELVHDHSLGMEALSQSASDGEMEVVHELHAYVVDEKNEEITLELDREGLQCVENLPSVEPKEEEPEEMQAESSLDESSEKKEEKTVPSIPFCLPPSNQLPPSSFHQANIGVPGASRPVVTYATLSRVTAPENSYGTGVSLSMLLGSQTKDLPTGCVVVRSPATTTATSAINTVLVSAIPSEQKSQSSDQIKNTSSQLTSLLSGDVQVNNSNSDKPVTGCSVLQTSLTTPPTRSTGSTTSTLLSSSLSSSLSEAKPSVTIVNVSSITSGTTRLPTTMDIINSAIVSTVTLPGGSNTRPLSSSTVTSLAADAVNAARLPYPPATISQQAALGLVTTAGISSITPSGISVIASVPKATAIPETRSTTITTYVQTPRMAVPSVSSESTEKFPVVGPLISRIVTSESNVTEIQSSRSSLAPESLENKMTEGVITRNPEEKSVINTVEGARKVVPQEITTIQSGDEHESSRTSTPTGQISQESRPSVFAIADKASSVPVQTKISSDISSISDIVKDSGDNSALSTTSVSQVIRTISSVSSGINETAKKSISTSSDSGSVTISSVTNSKNISESVEKKDCIKTIASVEDVKILSLMPSLSSPSTISRTSQVTSKTDVLSYILQKGTIPKNLEPIPSAKPELPKGSSSLAALLDQAPQNLTPISIEKSVEAAIGESGHMTKTTLASICSSRPHHSVTIKTSGQSMLESRLTRLAGPSVSKSQETNSSTVSAVNDVPSSFTSCVSSTVNSSGRPSVSEHMGSVKRISVEQPLAHSSGLTMGITTSGTTSVLTKNTNQVSPSDSSVSDTPVSTSVKVSVPQSAINAADSVLASTVSHAQQSSNVQSQVVNISSSNALSSQIQTNPAFTFGVGFSKSTPTVVMTPIGSHPSSGTTKSSPPTTRFPGLQGNETTTTVQISSSNSDSQIVRQLSSGQVKQEEVAKPGGGQLERLIKKEIVEEAHNSSLSIQHPVVNISGSSGVSVSVVKTEVPLVTSSSKYSGTSSVSISTAQIQKSEESQNVLLKQLLQNTACAQQSSSQPQPIATSTIMAPVTSQHSAPSLPVVPSLEAQLAQPVPPTPSSLFTPLLSSEGPQSLHTPSPLTSPQATIKREMPQSQISPIALIPPNEVKKEVMDDMPTQISTPERKDFPTKIEAKDEINDLELTSDKMLQDQASLDKKLKRRQYQQKRRQSQGKEAQTPKKRQRRQGSKVEEDYDSYIENLMSQLRQLPALSVLEPELSRNWAVCPIFGAGDLTKIGTVKNYNTRLGDLRGQNGNASLPGVSDYYNTQPYGDLPPLPPQPPVSTQRGFYNEEFAPIKLENENDDKKTDRDRDNDTPDTIVSSSSPECVIPDFPLRFPGLRLIEEDDESKDDDDLKWLKRASPVIPLFAPTPIRLKPGICFKDSPEVDKENIGVTRDHLQLKSKFGMSPSAPLRDSGNVTVTLTLTAAAAEDILGVLRDLANILHIPAPTGYHIVERTSTPPSQKLGLYRTKGKDGKEGAPIDIQSILNGAAKFCRHCDVVILNNLIKKKASELPFLAKEDLVENGDDLYFCSSTCYMQFALMHRSPSISEDKAAAIVDHLCQNQSSNSQKDDKEDNTDKDDQDGRESKAGDEDKMETDQDDNDSVKVVIKEEKVDSEEQKSESKDGDSVYRADRGSPSDTGSPRLGTEKKARRATGDEPSTPAKIWKGLKYKYWNPGSIQPAVKYKKPTDREVTEMLYRMGITMRPSKLPDDTRKCMFCHQVGDGVADGPARLLNFDVDKWVHLNCALWSDEVYETVNGALMNLENALQLSLVLNCVVCHRVGATLRCFKHRCSNVYHLACAVKDGCVFYKNKSIYCAAHVPKSEKDNELTTLSVFRRVYVNRDENRQVATVMHHTDQNNLMRVGSLIFLNVGHLLPHQLQAFHTPQYIYPIGYKIVRFYWSMRVPNKRCRYVCSIHDVRGRPEFRVLVQEPSQDDLELRDITPRAVWTRILEPLAALRKEFGGVQVFPRYLSGEDLFGLTEPAVVRVLESLPGVETLTDYRFKYGRNPLLELPLAVNPTGCARTEPKLRNQLSWKRAHTQRTGSSSRPVFVPTATISKIQGLGLYAARDLERHTMVIEYIGEVIRTELSELREKLYESKNRGIYMFRLDEERVVDATLSGGLARYINHSCNPNCVAEIVEVERDLRIIIFAKRRIARGEELAYDYKFDIEDDQHKIPCNCGAPNCRKWMN